MTACCVCWTEGHYRRADPRFQGLPVCQVCGLEALWQSRTQPSASPLFNPDMDQSFLRTHLLGLCR
jgi:hypothetical protein